MRQETYKKLDNIFRLTTIDPLRSQLGSFRILRNTADGSAVCVLHD